MESNPISAEDENVKDILTEEMREQTLSSVSRYRARVAADKIQKDKKAAKTKKKRKMANKSRKLNRGK